VEVRRRREPLIVDAELDEVVEGHEVADSRLAREKMRRSRMMRKKK
jgi:hypothetical protein